MSYLVSLLHLTVIGLPLAAAWRGALTRRAALAIGGVCFALTLFILTLVGSTPGHTTLGIGELRLLGLDDLTLWLLPFASIVYLAILLCTPRAERVPGNAERLLLALGLDLAFFSLNSPWALALLWPLTQLPMFLELKSLGAEGQRMLRIMAVYQLPGCLLFGLGAVTVALCGPGLVPLRAFIAVTLGIVLRKGIMPVHQWLPELFERGPLGQTIGFCATQVGAYASVRLLAPEAPSSLLVALGAAALVTSVYGACLACGQRSVRGAYSGLFLGQSSLVFAGLQCTTEAGLAGGLTLWISGGLALTGLGLTIWAVEARRGRTYLDKFQGGYDRSPILASCFLLMALTSIGFPGTLGFVSEELLLDGTTQIYPHVGLLAAVVSCLNGITVLRTYFCLFCGRRLPFSVAQGLRLRERVALLTLVALLLGLGLFPQRFVASRWLAAHRILIQRTHLAPAQIDGVPQGV